MLSEGGLLAISRKLLSVSLVFSAIACAADPALLNLVMPGAKIFAGVNVERILASPIGKEIDSKVRDSLVSLSRLLSFLALPREEQHHKALHDHVEPADPPRPACPPPPAGPLRR